MSSKLCNEFASFFVHPDGYCQIPGNFGEGRTVVNFCRRIMARPQPCIYDMLIDWDENDQLKFQNGRVVKVLELTQGLLHTGQWEGAWAVAQLYYDQLLKKEADQGERLHKGHPACGLAILARDLGAPSLSRHFALLSSAGDIYWEHEQPTLKIGGYGLTMLEQFQSNDHQQKWRGRIRSVMADYETSTPLFLEAFIAAEWFGTRAKYVYELAEITGQSTKPFVDVLLKSVNPNSEKLSVETGTRFEAASGLLIASTPGFEVDSARKSTDEQIDLVVRYNRGKLCDLGLEGEFGLVECKSSKEKVSSKELRDFGTKCLFHRVQFGILVTRAGVTGGAGANNGVAQFGHPQHAELVRRRFQMDGLTLLVLDISHLQGKSRELRGLQDDLRADHRRLVFGDVP